ncbi:hypothetical protein FACS189438_0580 [Bacteroidia bacterium]|nr:hypothetical protein FACS189438_0580 [Bacteroidia bacterium]
MKTLNYFLIAVLAVSLASCGASKNGKAQALDARGTDRTVLVKELNRKAIKQARTEAKNLKKQGYQTFIGDLPMDRQVENSLLKTVDVNDLGYQAFIVGHAEVTAGNITAAKSQALQTAKVEIASLTSSMIASLVESSVTNNEITTEDAVSINKSIEASKGLVIADLGQVSKELEIYRTLPNKNVHLILRLSYNAGTALEAARRRAQEKLEGEAQDLHKKLDNILKLDRLPASSNTNIRFND